jgi:hypothetical protein
MILTFGQACLCRLTSMAGIAQGMLGAINLTGS